MTTQREGQCIPLGSSSSIQNFAPQVTNSKVTYFPSDSDVLVSAAAWWLTSKTVFQPHMSSLRVRVSSLYRCCDISSCRQEGKGQWSEEVLLSQLAQLICVNLGWKVESPSSRHDPHIPLLPISLWALLLYFFIYPNLFFGFPLLQWKHAFRSLILKRSNKSTNSVSTSHRELQLSFLHVSPLSLLGTQFI